MWRVPLDILGSRDWGALPEYVARNAVVIVTGTWEGAELFDRPLAYIMADALASRGFFPIVMSDEFILNIGGRLGKLVAAKTPVISIGGSAVNAFTALVSREIGVSQDEWVGVTEWRGTVVGLAYGRDPLNTAHFVSRFLHDHLDGFIARIEGRWNRVILATWPLGSGENASLVRLLKEFTDKAEPKGETPTLEVIEYSEPTQQTHPVTTSRGQLPEDIESLWRFVMDRVSVVVYSSGEKLQPRIVRWWRSNWAPRRLLVEYVGEGDPSDPELFLEIRDECNGFLVVEAARFGATRLHLYIDGYMYDFEAYREDYGHFNRVEEGYLIHYIQAPLAKGAVVTGDLREAVEESIDRVRLWREPQVVIRWKGGRDELQKLLEELEKEMKHAGLKAYYKVYKCSEPRIIVNVELK